MATDLSTCFETKPMRVRVVSGTLSFRRSLWQCSANRDERFASRVVKPAFTLGVLLGVFCVRLLHGYADDTMPKSFNGDEAYTYLKEICALGRRPSGSEGMAKQQRLLQDHFTRLGGAVTFQAFDVRHPEDGSRVTMKNLIVQWHPERKERILVCAHYDTRPFPDQDRLRPQGVFIGANDGGSGVALLSELGKHMPGLGGRYGVDFVLFDGEEFLFDKDRDKHMYFLGSQFFAKKYVSDPPDYRYVKGVLLDMVGDSDLQILKERNSMRFAREVVDDVWRTANRLGVDEFSPRTRSEDIRDDHIPLNHIAKIPTIDLIDFDYPRPRRPSYWHTEQDLPDKCSAESLGKVGWVVLEWLKGHE